MSSCLVLIDIQYGFMNEYTCNIVTNIKSMLDNHVGDFDHIVATVFSNYSSSQFVRRLNWCDMITSDRTKLDTYVNLISEQIFTKTTYTCFTPEFSKYIANNNIDKIYLAGIDTDGCVLKSALDCFDSDIDVEVLLNTCASTGGQKYEEAAKIILERLIGKDSVNTEWK